MGGADDAEKSVAWLHRHLARGATSHPHPSKVCVETRRQPRRHTAARRRGNIDIIHNASFGGIINEFILAWMDDV